ncbi:MAG TPA: hypothetical protein PLO37_21770 [Candidatus Hydrogenedentes bacterium]|nr:hypothetical protein [Candidatus Hydrogenedentota bacterium]HPG69483.1 hypothetical protein [Candidatus Hydrogenedentota bacterium]
MLEFIVKPWHVMVLFLASQLHREQQRIIEHLQVENAVLREKLGPSAEYEIMPTRFRQI